MIDVLRGVGFIAQDKAARAKTEILDEDGIAWELAPARVFRLHAPEPQGFRRMQPKRHAVAKTRRVALPHETIMPCAEIHPRSRPRRLDNARLSPARPKQHARNASANGRAERLIQHDAVRPLRVLQRKQAAIRKNAEVEPGRVRDAPEAKAALFWGMKASSMRHGGQLSGGRPGAHPRR